MNFFGRAGHNIFYLYSIFILLTFFMHYFIYNTNVVKADAILYLTDVEIDA